MPPPPEFDLAGLKAEALVFSQAHPKETIAILLVGSLLAYGLGLITYRLHFHPLSKFPGPKRFAVTELFQSYEEHIAGTFPRRVLALHKQYGPIVRIGPNNLSVDGSLAWPQIWSHRKGKAENLKVPGYFGPGDHLTLIGGPTEVHRRQRRTIAGAFSEKAMYEQEGIISGYIQMLMEQLEQRAAKGEAIDLVMWLNFVTFDLIGDLLWGESFHCLDSTGYHPWVLNVFKFFRSHEARRFFDSAPILKPLSFFLPDIKAALASGAEQAELARTNSLRRIAQGASPSGRNDFMTAMVAVGRDGTRGLSDDEIVMNSPVVVTAGSETTATALSGLFFHLRNTPAYTILRDEIRGAFSSEADISMRSTASLPYLYACIEEALRIYPPAAANPPRVSNGDEVGGMYIPKDVIIHTYEYATSHNPANFTAPDQFVPERWLPASHPLYQKRFDSDVRGAMKPFSAGARDCVGKNLAYAEMRVITARILYRFDYEFEGDVSNWFDEQLIFQVWEKSPLMLKLIPRKLE